VIILVARKVLESEDSAEWEKYLEFPCKTKCFVGGGVM
jgi:hypothetical protein